MTYLICNPKKGFVSKLEFYNAWDVFERECPSIHKNNA